MQNKIEFVNVAGLVIPVMGAAAGVAVTVAEVLADDLLSKFNVFMQGWEYDKAVVSVHEGWLVATLNRGGIAMPVAEDFVLYAFLKPLA